MSHYILLLLFSMADSVTYRIGALMDSTESVSAVKYAVEYINHKNLLGPGRILEVITNTTNSLDSFNNIQTACQQAEMGVMAFIGPVSSHSVKSVCAIGEALNIPIISPVATNPRLGLKNQCPTLIRMMASDSLQSLALVALVEKYGWNRMAILSSDTDYGIHGLVRFQSEAGRRNWKVTSVLRFPVDSEQAGPDVSTQLNIIKDSGVRVVILNCQARYGLTVLEQARDLGMTASGWAWLVTDGITSYHFANTTVPLHLYGLLGTRPVSGNGALWEEVNDGWQKLDPVTYPGAGDVMTVVEEYIFDSILTFAYGLHAMMNDGFPIVDFRTQVCDEMATNSWDLGDELLSYIGKVDADGVAVRLQFNEEWSPYGPIFDIVNLQRSGWEKVGSWDQEKGLLIHSENVYFNDNASYVFDHVSTLRGETLHGVTIRELPFTILLNDSIQPGDLIQQGDAEGYLFDLMEKLAELIGFNYTIRLVSDGKFGYKNPESHQWNGMLMDLIDKNLDIAIAAVTINTDRERDFDFTTPFTDTGVTFVMKLEHPEDLNPWRFMDPFSNELWLHVWLTTFLVGICVSIYNKISPYDHHGQFVYVDSPRTNHHYKFYRKYKKMKHVTIKHLSFGNAIWFSVASFLQQGGDVYPKSVSGWLTAAVWWFLNMIIVTTYIANLSSYLTAFRSSNTQITSIEELAAQTKVEYGTVSGSNHELFFGESVIDSYKEMGEFMKIRKSNAATADEGLDRARAGGYAFIWDKAALDYVIHSKPCNTLKAIDGNFLKADYAFALPKNSAYQEELSTYILQLRERGFMDDLVNKWFRERSECKKESGLDAETQKKIEEAGGTLTVNHMLGVFYIVYGGQVLGIIILLVEWIVASNDSIDTSDPLSPHSLLEAVMQRLYQVRDDIVENWLPVLPHFCPYQCAKPQDMEKIYNDQMMRSRMCTPAASNGHNSPQPMEPTTSAGKHVSGLVYLNP